MSRWDDEDFDLDNWYEKALDMGFGFKSAEERQAYCDSLGDPLKHPMFATTTEDLEGNPMVEAFRLLREEDKTFVDLALMYKEEGNDWIRKKGVLKNYSEAYDRYTHALTFMKQASDARIKGTENEADAKVNLSELCSQILSNRAQASLFLHNYGSCRRDCTTALKLMPTNIKAHFRKCKALFMLKTYEECEAACLAALTVDAEHADILQVLEKCRAEAKKDQERRAQLDAAEKSRVSDLKQGWASVWKAAKKCKAQLGYHSYSQPPPAQLMQGGIHRAHFSMAARDFCWPVVFLYPQYNQLDVVHAVPSKDLLVQHLAVMFPEIEEEEEGGGAKSSHSNTAVPWDRDNEYHVSALVIYLQLQAGEVVSTEREWQLSSAECCVLHEGGPMRCVREFYNDGAANEANTGEVGTADAAGSSLDTVRETVKNREHAFLRMRKTQRDTAVSSVNWIPEYNEVHLGCTFGDILSAEHHVVVGGVLSLVVFVRDSESHRMFLAKNKDLGHKITELLPSAASRGGMA